MYQKDRNPTVTSFHTVHLIFTNFYNQMCENIGKGMYDAYCSDITLKYTSPSKLGQISVDLICCRWHLWYELSILCWILKHFMRHQIRSLYTFAYAAYIGIHDRDPCSICEHHHNMRENRLCRCFFMVHRQKGSKSSWILN